jgi:hypothetical protein
MQLWRKKMKPNENHVPTWNGRNSSRFIVSHAGPIDSVTRMGASLALSPRARDLV